MEWYLFLFLGLIAFLYSSVGHGGASGYLAFMGLIGFDTLFMKSTALTLNLYVAGIAFIFYYRSGYFKWRLLWPFVLTSVPFSFIGAQILIDPKIYKFILGFFLLLATIRMLIKPKEPENVVRFSMALALTIGAVLGLLSGMIGIGGGIILTPVIILLGWANIKEGRSCFCSFYLFEFFVGLVRADDLRISFCSRNTKMDNCSDNHRNVGLFYWQQTTFIQGIKVCIGGSISNGRFKASYLLK